MKTVEQLIDEYVSLSEEERILALNKFTMKSIASCLKYEEDYEEATKAIGVLTYAAIIADNRISDDELLLIYAGLKVTLGDRIDLDECKQIAAETLKNRDNYKIAAKHFAECYLSLWSDRDKEGVISLCIALCAIDGVVSPLEVRWLKELVAAATL